MAFRSHVKFLVCSLALALTSVPIVGQQQANSEAMDMREADASWVNDPNMKDFYRATVQAFANGPDNVDRAAFERRSREIFRAAALTRNLAPEPFLAHLAAIPGELIAIVKREPETLDSYDAFVIALFGPQRATSDSSLAQQPGSPGR